jgi:FAD/FMN-containing dehydrogenase/Fe-S oxidoreductase
MAETSGGTVRGASSSAAVRDQLSSSQVDELRQDLELRIAGDVRFDPVYRAMFCTDASVYQIMPLGVVMPKTAEDVVQVVKLCERHGASITARGGGTSQAGQAIGAGLQLDFSKHMYRLLELDVENQVVRVEPGIVLDELNAELKPHGLQLPLDLSTSNRATIGGMLANNSSGTRSIVYGKTIDFVEELSVVLADGSQVEMRRLSASELADRLAQTDREGACYRITRDLASIHAEEIQRRYPQILRRVGGYNLDEFVSPERFNLARMLVGSEGTLGLTVAATLRLAPLPKARAVCTVQFDDLLEAMAATPVILEHDPSAVELIDRFILHTTRGRTAFEPLRDFIEGDPGAVLIVEFFGERETELPARIDALVACLQTKGLGHHVYRAVDEPSQERIWSLRRAALGLSMSQRGDAKSISFVEDAAVAPEHLHDYIARFQEILRKYDTEAGFYAHASVGLLHIRPVVNMKTAEGVARFEGIANEVADLVLEFGGALSGEHGDGLVRAPFQEKMFGEVLYGAFCQLKATFDPDGVLNPGKIVDAPALTANLRFGEGYQPQAPETAFDFADFGGMVEAAEQCSGVGACRKRLTGAMCPSYMATGDESASTRGRANVLRLAMTGQLDGTELTDEALLPVFDLCLECKACKSECPTGVDMARLKSEFLNQYWKRHGVSRSARWLAQTDRIARWGSRLAPLSNWLISSNATTSLNERFLGLDPRRPLPRFAPRTFDGWWKRRRDAQRRGDVVLFVDTFSNYYEPETLMAAVRLAERWQNEVVLAPRVCCGRPAISKGMLEQARQQAATATQRLLPLARQGLAIVFCEPSCYSAVVDDHPHLQRGAAKSEAEEVAAACVTFEQWAESALERNGEAPGSLSSPGRRILLHGHCHQKALVGTGAAQRLLSKIPGCEVTVLDSGCCGMAGSFGYEHYEISRAVGEHRLFPAVRELDADDCIVASGFSCRQQIAHFTRVTALSPPVLLEKAYRGGAGQIGRGEI